MKLNTSIKTLCAAAALATTAAASATPFYLDVGTNYDTTGTNKVNAFSTSVKNEAQYKYVSTTTITDINGGGITAGDLVSTNIGLSAIGGTWGNTRITGFDPSQTGTIDSDNGYLTNYLISVRASNLQGVVQSTSGGVPLIAYGAGLIEMLISFDFGATYNNFMDLKVSSGVPTGLGTILFGTIDFTSVDAGYNNLFHTAGTNTCNGASGFFDIWSNCANGPLSLGGMTLEFSASQDTNVLISKFSPLGNNQYRITSNHDGSMDFNVPEPASLALLGMGLFGLGAIRRRKTAA